MLALLPPHHPHLIAHTSSSSKNLVNETIAIEKGGALATTTHLVLLHQVRQLGVLRQLRQELGGHVRPLGFLKHGGPPSDSHGEPTLNLARGRDGGRLRVAEAPKKTSSTNPFGPVPFAMV